MGTPELIFAVHRISSGLMIERDGVWSYMPNASALAADIIATNAYATPETPAQYELFTIPQMGPTTKETKNHE